jgi:hypothetical protein
MHCLDMMRLEYATSMQENVDMAAGQPQLWHHMTIKLHVCVLNQDSSPVKVVLAGLCLFKRGEVTLGR